MNEKIHPVETQWHYPLLEAAGFTPETKEASGMVRSYTYTHPDGRTVTASTGVNADHWSSSDGKSGYWSTLQFYCEES